MLNIFGTSTRKCDKYLPFLNVTVKVIINELLNYYIVQLYIHISIAFDGYMHIVLNSKPRAF